jgi:hypothetical protein
MRPWVPTLHQGPRPACRHERRSGCRHVARVPSVRARFAGVPVSTSLGAQRRGATLLWKAALVLGVGLGGLRTASPGWAGPTWGAQPRPHDWAEEHADALTVHDATAGYGHRDHVPVHRVGVAAAKLADTPVVFEATVSTGLVCSVLLTMRLLGRTLGRSGPMRTATVLSSSRRITHRIRVDEQLMAKRKALSAHGSRQSSDGPRRSMDEVLALLARSSPWSSSRSGSSSTDAIPRSGGDLVATLRGGSGTEVGAP